MRGRGSADAGLISAVLAGGDALCLECIATKTGVPIGWFARVNASVMARL